MPPPGNTGAVLIVSPATIVMLKGLLAVFEALSVTCTVKLKVPVFVGVPLMVPEVESIARPLGSAPEITAQ